MSRRPTSIHEEEKTMSKFIGDLDQQIEVHNSQMQHKYAFDFKVGRPILPPPAQQPPNFIWEPLFLH